MKKHIRILLFTFFIGWASIVNGQSQDIYSKYGIYRNPLRVFLNKISWDISTGYSAVNFNHNLKGFYYLQDTLGGYIFSKNTSVPGTDTLRGFSNWFNNPILGAEIDTLLFTDVPFDYLTNPVNNPLLKPGYLLVDGDTSALEFSQTSPSIPIHLGFHVMLKRFRLGAGLGWERVFINTFRVSSTVPQVRNYTPNIDKSWLFRWNVMAGYTFHQYWNYDFVAEIDAGKTRYGGGFNRAALTPSWMFSFAFRLENLRSEYLRYYIRPSYDLRNYTIKIPDGATLKHLARTPGLQIGVIINIPEIKRTPFASDGVQLKHVITDPKTGQLTEVRGQPFYKWQNPKVGQNHRRLVRYKWRNRRKMQPY